MIRREHDAMPGRHRSRQPLNAAALDRHHAMTAQQPGLQRAQQSRPEVAPMRREERVGFGDYDRLHGEMLNDLPEGATALPPGQFTKLINPWRFPTDGHASRSPAVPNFFRGLA